MFQTRVSGQSGVKEGWRSDEERNIAVSLLTQSVLVFALLGKYGLKFKVPLLCVIKGSYFGFGSPQQQADMHARSKNTFIF